MLIKKIVMSDVCVNNMSMLTDFFYINVWNCEIERTSHHLLEKKDIPFQNWIVPSPEQVVRETHIQLYRNACKARSCILAL